MNLNIVYDRAYENAMRQGYTIDGDLLRACIDTAASGVPPFPDDQLEEILLYIKEKTELLPTDPQEVPSWRQKWTGYFKALRAWQGNAGAAAAKESQPPPLLCDFGL